MHHDVDKHLQSLVIHAQVLHPLISNRHTQFVLVHGVLAELCLSDFIASLLTYCYIRYLLMDQLFNFLKLNSSRENLVC